MKTYRTYLTYGYTVDQDGTTNELGHAKINKGSLLQYSEYNVWCTDLALVSIVTFSLQTYRV